LAIQSGFAYFMNHLENDAVLSLKIGQSIQVDFTSPKARALLGAKTDAETQAILESTNFFSTLRQKLQSESGNDDEEGLRLCTTFGEAPD
jgi:hypothetical protein